MDKGRNDQEANDSGTFYISTDYLAPMNGKEISKKKSVNNLVTSM